MRVLTARYRTACGVCRGVIVPGDEMVSLEVLATATWAHARCHPEGAATALLQPDGRTPARPAAGTTSRRAGRSSATPTVTPGNAVEAYTDGACSGNPGAGGWAWAVSDGRQACGAEAPSTNQRMEIRAALEAVRSLDGPLVVVSDSTYVVNCFRDKWWEGWLRRDWQNSARRPVANRDLWQPLVELVRERGDVTFRWVKGHSGDPMNELADRLAVAAAAAS